MTGTPGGTAITAPGLLDSLALFVTGGFSVEGAKREFVAESEENVDQSSYLEAGDVVESWIEELGRQRWTVVEDASREPYGVDASGACPADAFPVFQ